mgnify:FL=1
MVMLPIIIYRTFYDDGKDYGFDTAFWLMFGVLAYMAYDNDKKSNRLLLLEQKVEHLSNHIRK